MGAAVDVIDIKRKMRWVFEHAQEAKNRAKSQSESIRKMWSWDEAAKKAISLMQSYLEEN
jgi:hypothetical protein